MTERSRNFGIRHNAWMQSTFELSNFVNKNARFNLIFQSIPWLEYWNVFSNKFWIISISDPFPSTNLMHEKIIYQLVLVFELQKSIAMFCTSTFCLSRKFAVLALRLPRSEKQKMRTECMSHWVKWSKFACANIMLHIITGLFCRVHVTIRRTAHLFRCPIHSGNLPKVK